MTTCTAEVFAAGNFAPCGKPATVRLTITGADAGHGMRAESRSTSYNIDDEPRCAGCLAVDRRVVTKYYPEGWTFTAEPIT